MDADLVTRYLRHVAHPRVGTRLLARLLQCHGNLDAVQSALRAECPELDCAADRSSADEERQTEAALEWSAGDGCTLLLFEQTSYPALLREIDCPPPLLFVQGDVGALSLPTIAMVGARRCSEYGRQQALWLATELAARGLVISSGLAQGIDAAAHQGALAGGGVTVAVLGTGIDRVYPQSHEDLAERIKNRGALVSEFPLGMPALPANFPRRNRIVTGLALAALVVEAGLRSGSLISARLATEQNREVLAVPGAINRATARGCHQLIRQGAKLIEGPEDVLEELPAQVQNKLHPQIDVEQTAAENRHQLPASALLILEQLEGGSSLYDTLLERTRLPASELTALLLELQMAGLVKNQSGRYLSVRS